MDIISYLMEGFIIAFTIENLILVVLGCFFGTIIGMLPGIGPINAIAILFPVTFALGIDATSAIIMFAGIFYGSQYGNSISSILLNVPGTATAAVTAIDGYAMAKKGRAGPALAMSAIASFIGGTISIFWLVLLASFLSKIAISFGPAQYFVLMIFAFTSISSLAGDKPIKSFISALIGVMIATVGIDTQTGSERFTLGSIHFIDGFDFIVLTIGFFAISEVFYNLIDGKKEKEDQVNRAKEKVSKVMITLAEFKRSIFGILRSNISGFLIGVLPGVGATIASFIAYNHEKKIVDKENKTFGKGDIHGVAAPESANNSSAVGSFIPLLILGIPGSETTAVMLAALISFGIAPGPQLLESSPEIFWGLAASMFIGNIILIILNLPLVRIFVKILSIPKPVIMTLVVSLSIVGVYAISNNYFDIVLMVFFGLAGYFLRKSGFPLAPLILGLVLGDLLETNLRRAMSYSDGSISILFEGGINIVLWILILISIVLPILLRYKNKIKANKS